jgi:hypothetical protein
MNTTTNNLVCSERSKKWFAREEWLKGQAECEEQIVSAVTGSGTAVS